MVLKHTIRASNRIFIHRPLIPSHRLLKTEKQNELQLTDTAQCVTNLLNSPNGMQGIPLAEATAPPHQRKEMMKDY